jgi:hypothetical protein
MLELAYILLNRSTMKEIISTDFYKSVASLLHEARNHVLKTVNLLTMVRTYYEVGRKIVEEEQQGKERADYGQALS